jgi:hypothetical protein
MAFIIGKNASFAGIAASTDLDSWILRHPKTLRASPVIPARPAVDQIVKSLAR